MKTITLNTLNEKLKNAPQSVLERVVGYIDALLEPTESSKPYTLSLAQQQLLDSQLNTDKNTYIDADKLYDDLKSKYEL
jgi:hypothetical protein